MEKKKEKETFGWAKISNDAIQRNDGFSSTPKIESSFRVTIITKYQNTK